MPRVCDAQPERALHGLSGHVRCGIIRFCKPSSGRTPVEGFSFLSPNPHGGVPMARVLTPREAAELIMQERARSAPAAYRSQQSRGPKKRRAAADPGAQPPAGIAQRDTSNDGKE